MLKNTLILVISNNLSICRLLYNELQKNYIINFAKNGDEGITKAEIEIPSLILLSNDLPDMSVADVCKYLRSNPSVAMIPIILLLDHEVEFSDFDLGATDLIHIPTLTSMMKVILHRIKNYIELFQYQQYLESLVEQRAQEVQATQREVIFHLAKAAEYRDTDTGFHIKRISYYSTAIATQLGFSQSDTNILFYAAMMHDIGKIGIPDRVLLKPGKLTEDEWGIMKTHTLIGARLLENGENALLRVAKIIALNHHERWDGTGYPRGIKEHEIPIESAIVSISDVFDSLLSERVYKPAWTVDKAIKEINEQKEKQFSPLIVHAFNAKLSEILQVRERFLEGSA